MPEKIPALYALIIGAVGGGFGHFISGLINLPFRMAERREGDRDNALHCMEMTVDRVLEDCQKYWSDDASKDIVGDRILSARIRADIQDLNHQIYNFFADHPENLKESQLDWVKLYRSALTDGFGESSRVADPGALSTALVTGRDLRRNLAYPRSRLRRRFLSGR